GPRPRRPPRRGHARAAGRGHAPARPRPRRGRRRSPESRRGAPFPRRAALHPPLPRRGERHRGRALPLVTSINAMSLLEIFDPKPRPRPIGIDLGTTNSLVARVRDGRPYVIADCDQERLVPSAVHYDDRGGVVVGRQALRLATLHPHDTIVSVKRFMGRGADDPETRRLGTYDFVVPRTPEEARSVRFKV